MGNDYIVLKDEFGEVFYEGHYNYFEIAHAMEEYFIDKDQSMLQKVFRINLEEEQEDIIEEIIDNCTGSTETYYPSRITFDEIVKSGMETARDFALSSDSFTDRMLEAMHDHYQTFLGDNAKEVYYKCLSDEQGVVIKESKYLWQFYWDCGRSGSVEGLFIATEKQISEAVGEHVNFGEILGKHSEVYGTLDENDLTKLDLKPETVEEVSVILGDTWSGYNPLKYIYKYCDECGGEWGLGDIDYPEYYEDIGMKVCKECHGKVLEQHNQ